MDPRNSCRLCKLLALLAGQTLLLAATWGLFAVAWTHNPLTLPSSISTHIFHNPTMTTLVSTFIGTLFSIASTYVFCYAYKEALRHRIHKPLPLIRLEAEISKARANYFFSLRHPLTTLVALILLFQGKLLVSSWTTLVTPTFVGQRIPFLGAELDLSTTYFESQLGSQLVATGGALPAEDNSLKIIDIDGLLSGINTAQYGLGVQGSLAYNGDVFNVSTGGVLPAVSQAVYGASKQEAQLNATGLNFVGGSISTQRPPIGDPTTPTNWSILQQGLTADVTCTPINSSSAANITKAVQDSIPVSVFSGNYTSLSAFGYSMPCAQGNPARSEFALRNVPANGLVYCLVCPYPVNQTQLDWTRFNVTSQGTGRYNFLQLTTCEITPRLTTSQVSYAYGTTNVIVVNSTALTSTNANLQLFLASIVDFQSRNAQSLLTNSIGDALYAVAASMNTTLSDSGPMDPRLLRDLENYWRGVIEFSGTYLRSGFSANPIVIPSRGLTSFHGEQIVSTIGWAVRSLISVYALSSITFSAFLTYHAIYYSIRNIVHMDDRMCTDFDPTNPLHVIVVSSTRDKNEPLCLKGEEFGGFDRDIKKYEDIEVELRDHQSTGHAYFVRSPGPSDKAGSASPSKRKSDV